MSKGILVVQAERKFGRTMKAKSLDLMQELGAGMKMSVKSWLGVNAVLMEKAPPPPHTHPHIHLKKCIDNLGGSLVIMIRVRSLGVWAWVNAVTC